VLHSPENHRLVSAASSGTNKLLAEAFAKVSGFIQLLGLVVEAGSRGGGSVCLYPVRSV
jgi:hypothetical protein